MTRNQKILAGVAAVVAIIALIFIGRFIADELKQPSTDTSVFQSSEFSFSYPRTYTLREFANGAVVLGSTADGEFQPVTQVIRYTSDPDSPLPPSYGAYLARQAVALCGSDNNEVIECEVSETEAYTSPMGMEGQRLILAMTRTDANGVATETVFGPIYAFDTTEPRTPERTFRYQTVLVSPALAAVLAGTPDEALLDAVLSTLTIGEVSFVEPGV